MFNPPTMHLWQEIEAAQTVTARRLKHVPDIIRRLCGGHYDESQDTDAELDPENHHYSFVANMLPDLAENDPEVKVSSSRVVGHRMVSAAMQDGEQSWIGDADYLETLETIKIDYLTGRGILLHNLQEETRFNRGIVRPRATRVSPRQFFVDALATSYGEAEFMGHWYFADLDDLMADPNITPEARERLAASNDGQALDTQAFLKPSGSELGRKRVKLYSVWIRSTGKIRVLVNYAATFEVYPELDFYGPPNGPYQVFDSYILPDEVWPLAPMIAVDPQVVDLNVHARAMGRSAARRKSVGIVEASNPDLADVLVKSSDGDIVVANGITGGYVQAEVGGVTAEQVHVVEYLRERLDRISGLTATAQGVVGKAKFATEVADASASLGKRSKYIRTRFMQGVVGSLWKIGWYLFNTEGIVIPVSRRDEFGRVSEGLFFGGPFPTDQGATWDDFDITIKLNTMQQSAEYKMAVLEFWNVFKDVTATALAIPGVQALTILEDIAKALGIGDIAEAWINPALFGQAPAPGMGAPSQVLGPRPVPARGGAAGPLGARGGYRGPDQAFRDDQANPGGMSGAPRPIIPDMTPAAAPA